MNQNDSRDGDGRTDTETEGAGDWERVGRRAVWSEAIGRFHDFERHYRDVTETIDSGGDPTAEDLRELRRAHRELQTVIEERFAGGIEGAKPWEDAAVRIPYGELARSFGVTLEALKEADPESMDAPEE